jgi:hypothetical protein
MMCRVVVVWLLLLHYGRGQVSNAVLRTSNSVDVQVCVTTAFLTPLRGEFQTALLAHLTKVLNSDALYLDRQYTTAQGGLCYLYVYQGTSPSNAVQALERLTQKVSIPLGQEDIECSVTAAQWSGDDLSYLGAPFPQLWTVNDLVLWTSCVLAGLSLCVAGICCFALCKLRQQQQQLALSSAPLKLHGNAHHHHHHGKPAEKAILKLNKK